MQQLKYIGAFILFFLLFYLDTLLDNAAFSYSWKILFVAIIIIYLISKPFIPSPKFIKIKVLWALEQIVNIGSLTGSFIFNTLLSVRSLMLVFLFVFFERKFQFSTIKLYNLLIKISQFFALSCLIFMLGILKQPVTVGGDYNGFTGLFGAVHATAAVMSTVSIILLFHIKTTKLCIQAKIFNLLLAIVSIIATYGAYTRTGWVMLLTGLVVLYIPTKIKLKQIIASCFAMIAVIGICLFLYENVDSFRYRINDISPETGMQYAKGSGRNIYRAVSVELWEDGNINEKLWGVGLTKLMDNMYDKIGARIFSHNGYIDALTANGLIGLGLMIAFIIYMSLFVYKRRHTPYGRLGFVVIIQYVAYQATQGSSLFQIDLINALILSVIAVSYQEKNYRNKPVQ